MIDAMGKYAPSSPIWVYDERSAHKLRAYVPAQSAMGPGGPVARPSSPPRLRLAGDPGSEASGLIETRAGGGAGSLLTDEELAMLLSDDPAEPGVERGES